MKRVLVIPSWYPSIERPLIGTFFQEQARLSRSRYDTRVLVVRRHLWGRRSLHHWLRTRYFGPRVTAVEHSHDVEGLPVTRIDIELASHRDPFDAFTSQAEAALTLDALDNIGWVPDVVHCHCAVSAGVLGWRIAAKRSLPLIVSEHQHIIFDYFDPKHWKAAKEVYAQATRVAAVSEFQKQILLMNGSAVNPVVIGNYVDEQLFALASGSATSSAIKLLFVGLASPLKDYATFFNSLVCLKRLRNTAVQVKIICADTAERRANVETQALEHRSAAQIEVVPSAGRQEVVDLLHWSNMLISTSVAETFGVAVCEALMCGRPVVTTASGGISDFVAHGRNGFVVRIGDAENIAQRVLDIIDGKLTASSSEIRNSVVRAYGREAFLDKLTKLYEGA
jgi:glycosyltransferase involved in cell wall biosynthesis